MAFQINRQHSTSLSYGLFNQRAEDDINKYTGDLRWQSAQHYILNYSYAHAGKSLRLELFQKSYDHLIRYNSMQPTYNSMYNNMGKGTVSGVDVFWKDNRSIRNLQYWVSYSYTDAKKLERNYPFSVQPSYVADHYFSVVSKYWIGKWRSQVGLTNTFIAGRPYNDPNASGFMQFKTKSQNDLSLNWSYLLTQQKIIHFSITNLLGNEPVFGYEYSQQRVNGVHKQRALTPNAKRFVFVGFFWTISKNKKDNQLDNL